jgi:hypothetical protein
MSDSIERANNQMVTLRNTLKQYKAAVAGPNGGGDRAERMRQQFTQQQQRLQQLVDGGATRDWEPLRRDLRTIQSEFAVAERQAQKAFSTAAKSADANAASSSGGAAGGFGAGGQQQHQQQGLDVRLIDTSALDTEEEYQRQRLQGVVAIEGQMSELKGMFQDFNAMVHEQQTGIDMIETNVDESTKHVERGVKDLQGASKHQKTSRKCMCILLGIVIAIIAVIVIIVVVLKK